MVRPMHRPFLTLAACLGCLAVGLGAFGAHGLSQRLAALSDGSFCIGSIHVEVTLAACVEIDVK